MTLFSSCFSTERFWVREAGEADDARAELPVVQEPHGDAVGVLDDVVVGQDVAVTGHDEPGAGALADARALLLLEAPEEVLELRRDRRVAARALLLRARLDEHDRRVHPVRHVGEARQRAVGAAWAGHGGGRCGLPPLRVAVNLSTRQLRELTFVSVVADVLKETGVEDGLEIEGRDDAEVLVFDLA